MTNRDRYLAIWNFQQPDYYPVPKFEVWIETVERWHREGLPEGADPNEYLGVNYSWLACVPIHMGPQPMFDVKVISRDERYVTLYDECGVKKRMLKSDFDATGGYLQRAGDTSCMSEWLDYPIHNYADWEIIRDNRFLPGLYGRLPADWEQQRLRLNELHKTEILNVYNFPFFGGLGTLRQYIGLENLSFMMYDHPQVVKAIVEDLTQIWISMLEQLTIDVPLDRIMFFEDMCSTLAPIISPTMFHEFFSPSYRRIISSMRERGVWSFAVDSDGNCLKMIPVWMEEGVNEIWPMQVFAGMDAEIIRCQYPQLRLHGGVNKVALAEDKDAIYNELKARFVTAKKHGGFFPWIDHLVPPNVSWDNIRYYVEYYRELGGEGAMR